MAWAPPRPDLVERFRADVARLDTGAGPYAVAVSGGPDSLALLLLACAAFPGEVRGATVDHGLRPESAAEAEAVARVCGEIGCPHAILAVSVPSGGEGIQGEARRARYRALGAWMRESGLRLLLTAHHADDQAETLLMRLQRGSGVAGLAGVRPARAFPEGGEEARLLRPLLEWRRSELAEIVAKSGFEASDDPSNRDEAYDRVRVRGRIGESGWLDPVAMARSAAALAEAEEALEQAAQALAADRIAESGGSVRLRPDGLAPEMLRRLVLLSLRRIAPDAAPRGEQLSALIASLADGRTTTLAGVKCGGGVEYRFEPEPPRS